MDYHVLEDTIRSKYYIQNLKFASTDVCLARYQEGSEQGNHGPR